MINKGDKVVILPSNIVGEVMVKVKMGGITWYGVDAGSGVKFHVRSEIKLV